jgi:site-specific DNA recombinase
MRAGIYIRVSTDEQAEGFSLDAQRRVMHEFCGTRSWQIVEEYVDEGKSARGDDIAKRPAFRRLMADAVAGLVDVVVVHKLDRFARNIRVTFEQFQVLHQHRVLFASVSEQGFDFTTPIGQVVLAVLAGFAQYYSDNLGQEVRKGKRERKAQGLYNGLLPFGVKKNSTGISVPDPETYPGLLLAFGEAAKGRSDREVALSLNEAGYRTTGNRGRNPFTKDTVRAMLQNRFYLGELPDGTGEWMEGAHDPMLDDSLFEAAQAARERRSSVPMPVRRQASVYSLSGLLHCHYCGGKLHLHRDKGRARAYCYQGRQGAKCPQRSTFLDVYEDQVVEHLETFTIPPDYRTSLVAAQAEAHRAVDDGAAQRRRLERQLGNLKTLFSLGDVTREEFLERRAHLLRELSGLRVGNELDAALEQAAAFLSDIPAAWRAASNQQRNALARLLFEQIRIKDNWVVAVQPQPEFTPFFDLDCQIRRLSGGSDGGWLRVCITSLVTFGCLNPASPLRTRLQRGARYQPKRSNASGTCLATA